MNAAPEWTPPHSAEELYARVQRFAKGEPVPHWLKHVMPHDAGNTISFARDCEVLYHGPGRPASLWPILPFTRNEPRLFFEAKLAQGSELIGDCEFWMQARS